MEPMLIIEIIVAVVMLGIGGFFWYKTKKFKEGLNAFGLLLPTLQDMAAKTDNKIDDVIIDIISDLVDDDVKEKIEKAKKK